MDKELNYLKLLEDLNSCYDYEIVRFEIPFSCIKDYPIDLPNKLSKIGFKVDLKSDSLLILFPRKNPLLNKHNKV